MVGTDTDADLGDADFRLGARVQIVAGRLKGKTGHVSSIQFRPATGTSMFNIGVTLDGDKGTTVLPDEAVWMLNEDMGDDQR